MEGRRRGEGRSERGELMRFDRDVLEKRRRHRPSRVEDVRDLIDDDHGAVVNVGKTLERVADLSKLL